MSQTPTAPETRESIDAGGVDHWDRIYQIKATNQMSRS